MTRRDFVNLAAVSFPGVAAGQATGGLPEASSIATRINGALVPILPAFRPDGGLDLDSTSKWVDWLIQSGVRLFWTTYGTSHFMCLSDDEVMELTKAVAQVTRKRAMLIASTNFHWSKTKCIAFCRYAADCGADVVKLQFEWRWSPREDQIFEHYRAIAQSSPLPLFAYSVAVPGGSSGMSTRLLERILELPQFVGLKNDAGDYDRHEEYLRTLRQQGATNRFKVMTGGTMASFLHGRKFGASAFATGVGMIAPSVPKEFLRSLEAGNEQRAVEIIVGYEEPITLTFGSMGHWSCYRTALWLVGRFASNYVRFPLRTLNAEEVERVRQCLKETKLL